MKIMKLAGYMKCRTKACLLRWYHVTKFRLAGNVLQPGVQLGKKIILHPSVHVGAHTLLGEDVALGAWVRVGSHAVLSRIKVGENSCIESRVICTGFGGGRIKVGRESYIGIGNVLDWSDDITIGDYVHIAGPSTALWTHSSVQMCLVGVPLNDKDKAHRPTVPIVIEGHVYIGGNCTIYPGVTIGHHSVVAPNSAVTKSIEPYSMVGGAPAKLIKQIQDVKSDAQG